MSSVTCITLSREPFVRTDLPSDISYNNYVSCFSTIAGLHKAQIEAIKRVKTKYFLFIDSDDPCPSYIREPLNAALLIGDEVVETVRNEKIVHNYLIDRSKYPEDIFMNMPTAIHKPVANTRLAQTLVDYFPIGNYYTNWMLYASMLKVGGYEYDKRFVYRWRRSMETGMHLKIKGSGSLTKNWLDNHMSNVVEQIKGMNLL